MNRISSYSYPLARPGDDAWLADRLREAVLAAGGNVHLVVTVEAPTMPAAVGACAELRRKVLEAGLPPLHFRDGADACPGCGRPEEPTGTGEEGEDYEGQGALPL